MAYLTNVLVTHNLFSHKFKYSSKLISYHCANSEGELEKERLTDKAQASVKCSLSTTLIPRDSFHRMAMRSVSHANIDWPDERLT